MADERDTSELFNKLFAENLCYLDFEYNDYTHILALQNILNPLPKEAHKDGQYLLKLTKERYFETIIKKFEGEHVVPDSVANKKNLFLSLNPQLVSVLFLWIKLF